MSGTSRKTSLLALALALTAHPSAQTKPRDDDVLRTQTARMQAAELHKVLQQYYIVNARLPAGWQPLLEKDASGKSYLDAAAPPTDPWGHVYRIVTGARRNEWHVVSDGPDGEPDTADDIDHRTARDVLRALRDLDGRPLPPGRRTTPLLIVFWSMRCPHARELEPRLDALATEQGDRLQLIVVASEPQEIGAPPAPEAFRALDPGDRPYRELREHLADRPLRHPLVIDHGGVAARYFGAVTTTHCVVVDQRAQIVYSGAFAEVSADRPAREHVREAVEAVLTGRSAPVRTTPAHGTPWTSAAAAKPKRD
jgi:hypothetical protein